MYEYLLTDCSFATEVVMTSSDILCPPVITISSFFSSADVHYAIYKLSNYVNKSNFLLSLLAAEESFFPVLQQITLRQLSKQSPILSEYTKINLEMLLQIYMSYKSSLFLVC